MFYPCEYKGTSEFEVSVSMDIQMIATFGNDNAIIGLTRVITASSSTAGRGGDLGAKSTN